MSRYGVWTLPGALKTLEGDRGASLERRAIESDFIRSRGKDARNTDTDIDSSEVQESGECSFNLFNTYLLSTFH